MRMFLSSAVVLLLVNVQAVFGQAAFNYETVSQDDWAVVLVRGLNLDQNRVLERVEDFTALLKQHSIAPKDGWQPKRLLTYQDFAGTIGLALIYLNSRDSKKEQGDFDKFLGFLDEKIGINVAQLFASLPKGDSYNSLNEGISNYLAQKGITPTTTETSPENTPGVATDGRTKTKGALGSETSLASANVINALADALNIRDAGPTDTNYWDIFSRPASAILP